MTQLQDIGGLRIVVDQNSDVDRLIEYITNKLKQQTSIGVKRIVDYRQKGRDDSGYRAAHIIMERDGVSLELQIRSRIQHYWAELIERTSVIYGNVIKELEGDKIVIDYFKELSNLFYLIETGQHPDSNQRIDIERRRIEAESIINESDTRNILSGYVNEGLVKTLVDKERRIGESNFNNWVFIFNWNQGIFVDWTIVGLNPDEAIKSYVEYENNYPADKGFEVVLVGTSSVANVRETHSHYFGLAQRTNILETLNESIVGFSNQMDIDVGARQILQTMERRRYWESKSISIDTLKNHYCQDVLTFEQSLNTLIEKELVQKVSNKVVSLNIKKKAEIRKREAAEREEAGNEVLKEIRQTEEKPKKPYMIPPLDLLKKGAPVTGQSEQEFKDTAIKLQQTLRNFGVGVTVTNISCGPTVTRYELHPEQGVKVSRILSLADDIKLNLAAADIRIEAPIPGKAAVGIEVPNKVNSMVYLRDLLESPEFKNHKSTLAFAVGKDIGGQVVIADLAKMPHLLIAGQTGSGKSVGINTMIMSLIYRSSPDDVKLIMIDPKMVELGVYNGIPHLYVPVVTDPKKAAGALQWSVVEMLKRYRLFSEVGVRDLESYNKHCVSVGEQTLPQVVIVIDELADLMLVASKEVEESICRVAQMGRAAGMHLVIATQRPSADVITGLMKANIPSRIAFAVSSAMESRIILDQGGAEKLVGMGDMLFSPVGCGKPVRIQGAFVSDEEREDVIRFIKEGAGNTAQNNSEIEEFMNKAAEDKNSGGDGGKSSKDEKGGLGGYDEMLPQAVEVVLETKSCSVSMLQRRVKLGYSRAARIVDQMEELGIVGPYEGAKPRQVVIDREGWNEIQRGLGLAQDSDLSLAADMSQDNDRLGYDE